jgi:hypothetical protein
VPPFSGRLLRVVMFVLGVSGWSCARCDTPRGRGLGRRFSRPERRIPWRPGTRSRGHARADGHLRSERRMNWGFNELSAAFFIGALVAASPSLGLAVR